MSEIFEKKVDQEIRVLEVKEHFLKWNCFECGLENRKPLSEDEPEPKILTCWNCGKSIIRREAQWKQQPSAKK